MRRMPSLPIRPYGDARPVLGARVYVDPAASVIGPVTLGDDVSIWPGAVLHVAHAGPYGPGFPCVLGAGVTVGHGAVVHACTVGDYCLIGMHATVLDGAVVGDFALIGAGAVVPPGKRVGARELWLGNPARCVRTLGEEDIERLRYSAAHYVRLKDRYLADRGAAERSP